MVETTYCVKSLARRFPDGHTGVLVPVSFIKNDDLMAPWRQCHLLLSKHLDLVSHNIYASAHDTELVSSLARIWCILQHKNFIHHVKS